MREVAYEATKEMDRTGKVRPAAEKIRAIRTPSAKPKAPPKYGTRRKHLEYLNAVIGQQLYGICIATESITELDHTVTRGEATHLMDDLSKQIRELNRIKTLLKERIK